MRRVLPVVLLLVACDEPVGPQPDQPIRPPPGYTGAPPEPPGPPAPPEPKPTSAEAAEPPKPAEPEPPPCPEDIGAAVSAKARPAKDKRKRITLELSAKSATGPRLTFLKVVGTANALAEEVKAKEGRLDALVTQTHPKEKPALTVSLTCNGVDRLALVTVDPKGGATVKEAPPPVEPGFLDVTGEKNTKVSLPGRELGVVPLKNVPLPPGKYAVKLTPAKGKPKTVNVEVVSGQHVSVDGKKR